jgi:hypothetical protein
MSVAQLRNPAEASPMIRVAIVCGQQTNVLADAIQSLLAQAKAFTFARIDCTSERGVKPESAGFCNADVVIATRFAFLERNKVIGTLGRGATPRSHDVLATSPNSM